jgi:RHS repeat-associated protein
MLPVSVLVIGVGLLDTSLSARAAATIAHWLGGAGDWSDPAHWDIAKVPNNGDGATYEVVLDDPSLDAVITVTQPITISGLTCAERLQVRLGGALNLSGAVANTGVLSATAGALRFNQALVTATGHEIVADGGLVEIINSTINGGVLRATDKATSVVQFSGEVTFNGVPWEDQGAGLFRIFGATAQFYGDYAAGLPAGYTLVVQVDYSRHTQWNVAGGEFRNEGRIELRGWYAEAVLFAQGPLRLSGGGELVLGRFSRVRGAAGARLTVGPGQRVIGEVDYDQAAVELGLTNEGTVEARQGPTRFYGPVENLGAIRAVGGGTVAFNAGVMSGGTLEVLGSGVLNLTGEVSSAADLVARPGTVVRLSGATVANGGRAIVADGGLVEIINSTINGGVLRATDNATSVVQFSGEVTFNGVPWEDQGAGLFRIFGATAQFYGDYAAGLPAGYTLVVQVDYSRHTQWNVAGGEFRNEGRIELRGWYAEAVLFAQGPLRLSGGGELVLGRFSRVRGAAGARLTVGPGQRVIGEVDYDQAAVELGLTNEGTVEARQGPTRFYGPVENLGAIRAMPHTSVFFAGDLRNSGIFEAFGGALELNGSLLIDGSGALRGQPAGTLTVRGHLLGNTSNADGYTPQLQLAFDGAGVAVPFLSGAFIIEAEDFNFDGGRHKAEADVMPYAGGAYQGLGGIEGIDFHQTANDTSSDVYRSGEGPGVNVNFVANADTHRGDYTLTVNYKLGWNDASEWYNYTRVFPAPARDYHVFARLSSGGQPNAIQFDEVTDGAGTLNQTLKKIGEARGPASGDWDTFVHVPVKDDSGALATVNFAGEKTVRVTILPGSNEDLNYFTFAPAELSGTAQLFEAMGRDLGPVSAGYHDNFAYGTVALGNNSSVRLVDLSANTSDGKAEAIYVTTLIMPASATLDLNGLHLYARVAQISGTVLGGSVQQVPDGGALEWSLATPGALSVAGELDEWTFYGRAGHLVSVVVNPGTGGPNAPVSPAVGWVQVRVADAVGQALREISSTQSGAVLTLADVPLPSEGSYRVQVRAAPGHESSKGNYTVTLWDVTPDESPLVFGQRFVGRLETPFSMDRWTFAALAGQQVRFDLVKVGGPSPVFTLMGPDGWVGFNKLTADSELVSLPAAGSYALTASSTGGQYGTSYAFQLDETAQTELSLGTAHVGNLVSGGQAQLFRLALAESTPLRVTLNDASAQNRTELYLKRGSPPTRAEYDHSAAKAASKARQILVPMATPGTWYILVYAGYVHTPGSFTLLASAAPVLLMEVTPDRQAANVETKLTLTGAGFDGATAVQFLAAGGPSYSASRVQLDSFTQLTASFAAGGVPAGRYAVRVARADGSSAELQDAFEMLEGGKPRLRTRVITPGKVGYHQLATIYIEYANVGEVTVPAPLLALTPKQNGRAAALLTLDKSRVTQGFWTTAIPEGFANTVQILASGKVPGTLQPGESSRVPVYWAGWQQPWDMTYPPVQFELARRATTDREPIDWPALKTELRPDWISEEAWEPIFENLMRQVGGTWGTYVAMLNENAAYLGRLGQTVTDIDSLWSFEIQQAIGFNPLEILARTTDLVVPAPGLSIGFQCKYRQGLERRYALGPLGRGWSTVWFMSLRVTADGAVEILSPSGLIRRFEPDSRGAGYFSPLGSGSTLCRADGGGFALTEPDGYSMRFLPDGKIASVEDSNGNRIVAEYTSGRLTRLRHSAGQWLAIAYNNAGRIESVWDSLGRTNSYTYDAANEHLLSICDYRGLTTQYSYSSGAEKATEHALVSIGHPDGTHRFFAYDANGRLAAVFRDGNAERIDFDYGAAGEVTFTKANGDRTRLFYDQYQSLARIDGPCCGQNTFSFDELHRVSGVSMSEGRRNSFFYTRDGVLAGLTDPLGNSETFGYGGSPRRMNAAIDARGNTTRYHVDGRGNVTGVTYSNQSQRHFAYDTNGNLLSIVNRRAERFAFDYGASGEVIREVMPDGQRTEFTYDTRGNLITASNAVGVIRCEYNGPDQMTRISYPNGRSLSFTYDHAGRRSRMVDHFGFALNYSYDALGRLSSVTDGAGALVVGYTYDATGRLSRKDHGNRTYSEFAYDAAGRPVHIVNHAPDGTVNSRFDYSYDQDGRVMAMTALDGQWVYEHDDAGQLTRAVFTSLNPAVPSQDLVYAYDPAGNRTFTVGNAATTGYLANTLNQYTKMGQTECAYDPEGNLVSRANALQKVTYSYDPQNRLTRVAGPEGIWEYEYDALGNRAAIIHDGQRTEYLSDPLGLGNVVGEFDATGNLVARYAYGLQLVSRFSDRHGAYYDFDANGSTAGLTDDSGRYVNRYAYDPFGRKLTSTEALANPFEFVGQAGVMNDGNGLTFMGARYYDPEMGRFLTEDPIGISGGDLNLYRYVGNAPLMQKDPSGYQTATTWCWQEEGQWLPMTIYYNNSHLDPCVEAHERVHQIQCQLGEWDDTREGCNKAEEEAYRAQHVCAKRVFGKKSSYAKKTKKELDLAKKGQHPSCDKYPPRPKPPPKPGCKEAGAGKAALLALSDREWPPPGDGDGDGSDGDDSDGDGFPDGEPGVCPGGPAGTAGPTDPNQKIGPPGIGPPGYVSWARLLPYRIDFENDPAATAPAQFVVVTDQLDANLDWNTFELTEVGFGDQFIVAPSRSQHFETVVPMRYNGRSFEVHVNAGLDLASGKLTARFISIDPVTELPPDVLTGFLPPEDGTGRGQGHISYVVHLKPGVSSGTEVRNAAHIQFDFGETIGTNQRDPHDPAKGIDSAREALITIDAAPPSSQVLPLPATTPTTQFTVSWTGSDDPGGSGIARFDIYYADDGGPWTLWRTSATQSSATFGGQLGHTYAFYSIATDYVGHREEAPPTPDAITTITTVQAPTLGILLAGTAVELSWPASAEAFILEAAPSLDAPIHWQPVQGVPAVAGDRKVIKIEVSEMTMFYRLRKP